MAIHWTSEILSKKSAEEIKNLRKNAVSKKAQEIVLLCDAELEKRKKPKTSSTSVASRTGQFVSEFHFVCPNESEVDSDHTGRMKTGTWVVSAEHADAAVKYGSMVALHITKAETSYLQGKITGWIQKPRQPRNAEGNLVANETGIEFEFEPTNSPLPWQGNGAGEKGYAWAPIPENE